MVADGTRVVKRATVDQLRQTIEKYMDVVGVSLDFASELDLSETDLVVVLGGDGSILRSAHQMGYDQRPVLGVNLGRLGFLAALQPEQLDQALPDVAAGRHQVIEHLMFECTASRGGETLCRELGLNEAEVLAGPPFTMIDVELYVDGDLATTYSADGLIVSTPVGSTAHCLAAGGPILRKNLQAFVILPLGPHTLTNRRWWMPPTARMNWSSRGPNEGTSLVVDGRVLRTLEPGDRVRIVRSEATFRMIQISGRGYYRTLHDKLGWGRQFKPKK